MNRMKRLWVRLVTPVSPLWKNVRAALRPALNIVLPACLLLIAPRLTGAAAPYRAERLLALLEAAALAPVFAAACACALDGAWNRRAPSLTHCVRTVKARILRVLATGVCVAVGFNILSNLLTLPLSLLSVLGWLPLVGRGIKMGAALAAALIELALATARPMCLAAGETALIAWGLWGTSQAREALKLLWGGRTDTLPALILLTLCRLALTLLVRFVFPAAWVFALLESLFDALCVVCAVVLCLSEHDRQYGWTL